MAWKLNNLTVAASAPPAASGSALDGYQTTSPNQQYVNYIITDNRVHELVYTDRWLHSDLTAATGVPLAAPGSPLDGYKSPGQQHVGYLGADNHIHDLVYGDWWLHQVHTCYPHSIYATYNSQLAVSRQFITILVDIPNFIVRNYIIVRHNYLLI